MNQALTDAIEIVIATANGETYGLDAAEQLTAIRMAASELQAAYESFQANNQ